MSETTDEQRTSTIPMSPRELLRIGVTGAATGALSVGLYALFYSVVFRTVLCRPQFITTCDQAPSYAAMVAVIVASLFGLIVLARMRSYRPLLVVLATAIALWGIQALATTLPWYWALVGMTVLVALAYALFAWIARLRSFVLAFVVTIVIVVVLRLIIVS